MKYAVLNNNIVENIVLCEDRPSSEWVIVEGQPVDLGDIFDNGIFIKPVIAVDLQKLKVDKRQEINESRLQANFSTFLHNGKVIACDQLSRSDIDGVNGYVGINGTLPPDFPGAWKAKDDSYLPIASVDAWKAFYLSMYNAGLGHFMKSQQLKAQVDACTAVEEVEAIKW